MGSGRRRPGAVCATRAVHYAVPGGGAAGLASAHRVRCGPARRRPAIAAVRELVRALGKLTRRRAPWWAPDLEDRSGPRPPHCWAARRHGESQFSKALANCRRTSHSTLPLIRGASGPQPPLTRAACVCARHAACRTPREVHDRIGVAASDADAPHLAQPPSAPRSRHGRRIATGVDDQRGADREDPGDTPARPLAYAAGHVPLQRPLHRRRRGGSVPDGDR